MRITALTVLLCFTLLAKAQQTENKSILSFELERNYLLYTPEEMSPDQEYPLLLFLHGGGESGDSIEKLKIHGPPKLIAEGKDFPFYVLSPQCPYKVGFFDDRVIENLLDQVIASHNIDTSRIYLAGLSRGGYGVWRMAVNNPDKFAAMISICAASIPIIYLKHLTDLPIWIFHGVNDDTVPVELSIEAFKKLKSMGGDVKLTLYPEAKHDSWTETFENDSIYKWLLSHRLKP